LLLVALIGSLVLLFQGIDNLKPHLCKNFDIFCEDSEEEKKPGDITPDIAEEPTPSEPSSTEDIKDKKQAQEPPGDITPDNTKKQKPRESTKRVISKSKITKGERVVTHSKDSITYRTKLYNGKEWMIDDLLYEAQLSKLVQKNDNGKTVQSRLYGQLEVNKIQLCPDGWRIPTKDEWKNINYYQVNDFNIKYFGAYNSLTRGTLFDRDSVGYYWVRNEDVNKLTYVAFDRIKSRVSFGDLNNNEMHFLACRCING